MSRYVSAALEPGSRTARSASRTYGRSASASENSATVVMPIARAVRMILAAISPRFAMQRLCNVIVGNAVLLHAEDAEAPTPLDDVGVHGGERDAQHGPRVARDDHAVVVELPGVEEGVRLALDLLLDAGALYGVGLLVEWLTRRLGRLTGDDRQHAGELLRTHHRHLRVRPREQEARAVGTPAHAVVPRAIGGAHDHREVRHRAVRHSD